MPSSAVAFTELTRQGESLVSSHPRLSLVVPFFNEEEGIPNFAAELRRAAGTLPSPVEVLLINDGSTDGTGEALRKAAEDWPECRIFELDRNSGQAAALYAGLRLTRAPLVGILDGDGQNVPGDLGLLLRRLEERKADLVVGVRAERNDSWLRRRMSRIANAVRGKLLNDQVSDSGCGLKVFRREVIDALLPIRTLYSFIPALAVAAGFRVAEQEVQHRARESGVSKYGLGVMWWRPLIDMIGVWWFAQRRFPIVRSVALEAGEMERALISSRGQQLPKGVVPPVSTAAPLAQAL